MMDYIAENVTMGENCKIYSGAQVKKCSLGNNVVIGEDSYVTNSKIGEYCQINRRNQIDDAVIGNRTFTGANMLLKVVNTVGQDIMRHDLLEISSYGKR